MQSLQPLRGEESVQPVQPLRGKKSLQSLQPLQAEVELSRFGLLRCWRVRYLPNPPSPLVGSGALLFLLTPRTRTVPRDAGCDIS